MTTSLRIRRGLSLLLCLALLLPCTLTVSAEEKDSIPLPPCYQQNDPRWGHLEQLAPGGCGILSLVNAVYFLTGNFINPVELAAYARSIDAYYGSVGGGTARWVLYHQLEDYEKTYGFKVTMTGKTAGAKHGDLISHLAKGGTAVAHVKGHFIALCGYDEATDSMLVYDCAATPDRETAEQIVWKTTDFLCSHPRMTVDWFCLVERTGETAVSVEGYREVGENRALYASVRHGLQSTEPLVLKGSVSHKEPLDTLFYVWNYDYTQVYETGYDLGGKPQANFEVPLELKNLDMGSHTLRLSARTKRGSVVDIAEYTVFITDGRDGFDPTTGVLTVNMSGYVGQPGITANIKSLGADIHVYRSTPDNSLYLGYLDLSQYTAVTFCYSAKTSFFGSKEAVIELRSAATPASDPQGDGMTLVSAVFDQGTDDISQSLTLTVDLTEQTYNGQVWVSVIHPMRQYLYLRELRFYTGEIPAETPPETQAPTEPQGTESATAPDITDVTETTPATSSPTEAAAQAPATQQTPAPAAPGGCGGCVTPILPVLLAVPALLTLSKKRRITPPKRRG